MLRSEPIKVHWAGFESNTHTMQQAGWKISAYEDVASMQMRLAFSRDGGRFNSGQPNQLRGISSYIPYDYRRRMDALHGNCRYELNHHEVVAEIQAVGSRVHLHEHNLKASIAEKFHPVDCTPQMWQGKISSLDDYAHFAPATHELTPADILVTEPDVEELLAKILSMQEPAKKARATQQYYEERESGLMVPKVHAKIISIQDYKAA
jgi:hypothetical protein